MHRMGEVTGAAHVTASCFPELVLGISLVDCRKSASVMNNHPHGTILYRGCMYPPCVGGYVGVCRFKERDSVPY